MTTALESWSLRSFPRTKTSQQLMPEGSLCGTEWGDLTDLSGFLTGCSGREVIGGGGVSQSEDLVGSLTCQGMRTLPPRQGKDTQITTCHPGH